MFSPGAACSDRWAGRPPTEQNNYANKYVERLANDESWLSRMSDALVQYKWEKNHQGGIKGRSPTTRAGSK